MLDLFADLGVLQKGHFKLTSGAHSAEYMQCAKLFEYPKDAELVVGELIQLLPDKDIETIVAPAIGGITIGYELARQLNCRFIFAERRDGQMVMRRGFTLKPGEKVLAVEDVVTTGGSVQEVVDLCLAEGAEILGIAALVDRSQGKNEFQVPFIPLVKMAIKVYQPEDCPMCRAELPLVQPGSRSN